jgi:hypothetical protein
VDARQGAPARRALRGSSEGSALIASSSGSESAHESDALGGSFFTHHFAAALRGAGDERHRGEVTLTEAFEYARQQTVRETARRAAEPQHPSFAINLKGRQDLVLAQVTSSPSSLAVEQDAGPIELVHLGTGLRLLELPPGRRQVTVAVPPGTYLVRRIDPSGVRSREVVVPPTGTARVNEHDLVLVGQERLVLKGDEPATSPGRWPRAGGGELGVGLQSWRNAELDYWGLGTGDPAGVGAMARFDGRLGLTDRLAWKIGTAALTYRFGEPGGIEVAPWGGLHAWKVRLQRQQVMNVDGYLRGASELRFGAGIGARLPLSFGALVFGLDLDRNQVEGARQLGTTAATLGLTARIGPAVTVHVAVAFVSTEWSRTYLGSVQSFGLESLPLVRVDPWGTWALDLFASAEFYNRVSGRIGVSRRF